MSFDISLTHRSEDFLLGCIAEIRSPRTMQVIQTDLLAIHMQKPGCRERIWSRFPFGQYLDPGFEGLDIHATDRALQAMPSWADGRQWKAPVFTLLGAPKISHQATAGVGKAPPAFVQLAETHPDLTGPGTVVRGLS